jgi:AcrR family transcriptional regulator
MPPAPDRPKSALGKEEGARRRPGRPGRGDGAINADAILDAALRAFATHGYSGVSVRTLNQELGVSHSLISQRFGSKDDLWYAAVDHGFGRIIRHMADVFDPTISDPLEQLRGWIHRYLLFSADHPELLGLMSIEGRQDTPRLRYVYEHYIGPAMGRVGDLLEHLADNGRIRRMPLRTFHMLVVHGGASAYTLVPLAERFDHRSPLTRPAIKANADLVTEFVIAGLRIDGNDR